jgi:hypothetical protein
MILETRTESLSTNLTDEEFMARARDLARANQNIEALEQRQTDMKAQMKVEMTSAEAEQGRLTLIVARKAELRDVEVLVLADLKTGIARYVRQDTGEEYRTRPLTVEERQEKLPLEE